MAARCDTAQYAKPPSPPAANKRTISCQDSNMRRVLPQQLALLTKQPRARHLRRQRPRRAQCGR